MNKVILIGHIGNPADIRHLPSGDPIATFNLATTRRWKAKDGERKEETEWHRVTCFAGLASIVERYTGKGSKVCIEGRIKTDKYQKDGVDVYRTGIIAENLQLLDSKPRDSSAPAAASEAPDTHPAPDYDDDIQF